MCAVRKSRAGQPRPSELIEPRNAEIRQIARRLRRDRPGMTIEESLALAVNMPASRWWISEERAAQVVGQWRRLDPQLPKVRTLRMRLYAALYELFKARRRDDPGLTCQQFAWETVTTPAPEHFVTVRAVMGN